jgi:hypothetical protein
MIIENAITVAAYGLAFGAASVVGGMAMYLLCEAIEKALEILEGDIDG